jgi:hypothetical protein
MGRTLGQMLQTADEIIEKRASAPKTPEVTSPISVEDDDIFKLASSIRGFEEVASVEEFTFDDNEKLANSMAILETVFSAPELSKLMQLEKVAKERGISDETINGFYEKVASATNAGGRISSFMHGAGDSLQRVINSIPGKLHGDNAAAAGQVAGAMAPFAAAAGLGGLAGSHLKEKSIKKQLGVI